MEKRQYVIPFEGRTKKNSLRIVGTGPRCPRCGKAAKQWVRPSKAYEAFAGKAVWYIRPRPKTPLAGPVCVTAVFYMGTRRRVDLTNLLEAVDDLLVDCKVVADDNSEVIASHDGSRVRYDPENPRVEITIQAMEGQE